MCLMRDISPDKDQAGPIIQHPAGTVIKYVPASKFIRSDVLPSQRNKREIGQVDRRNSPEVTWLIIV